jgi:hypothetical protein
MPICDPALGYFTSVPHTASSNRECQPIVQCQIEFSEQTQVGDYISAEATESTNRECSPLTTCLPTEFESVQPTLTSDRTCAPTTDCADDEYASVVSSVSADRVCTELTTCAAGEFETAQPTTTSDRQCSSHEGCGPGQYRQGHTDTASGTCVGCEPGTYSPYSVSVDEICSVCPSGYHGDWSGGNLALECTACAAGKFSSTNGQETCDACEAGKISEATAAETCNGCALGSYAQGTGGQSCAQCPAGRFHEIIPGQAQGVHEDECAACAEDTFAAEPGQASCTPCPQSTITPEWTNGQTGSSYCECKPLTCEFEWGPWSPCSTSCGVGWRYREPVIDVEAFCGPPACPKTLEWGGCNEDVECPVDCDVGEWSPWDRCTGGTPGACGDGTKTRTRTTVEPLFGGLQCPSTQATASCSEPDNAMVCEYGAWDDWGSCSEPCGGGTRERSRLDIAQLDDRACTETHQIQACNSDVCPDECESEFLDWTACSVSCGGGFRVRPVANFSAAYSQSDCPLTQDEVCNPEPCLIPCRVGVWGDWGDCSQTCGNGTSTRTREVCGEQGDADLCPRTFETRSCEIEACPLPTASPTAAPIVIARPVINVFEGDVIILEATTADEFTDTGASCVDSTDGDLSPKVIVQGVMFPRRQRPGTYKLNYDCVNSRGASGVTASKQVVVRDTTCPTCTVNTGADTYGRWCSLRRQLEWCRGRSRCHQPR